MEISSRIIAAILAVVFLRQASAAKHTVGGSQGWDESTDFNSWASAQTFKVGDELEFKYSSLHSVVELPSESAFKSCDISSASNSLNGGDSKVKLNKAGTRYFACGTSGHCQQGMKVKITTVAADASAPSPSAASPSSPAADSPSSAGKSSPASTSSAATGGSSTPAAITQSSAASSREMLCLFAFVSSLMAFFM